ncbi:MAG: DUF86 domain-containing protein [Candidatus Aminicenantes bacterium]|nr:DUF86 domain-containing protein [Candidatus Aminicenantes bacterium]
MLDRLKLLEENLTELALFKEKHKIEEIKKGKSTGWALKYGFLESIQIIIDISCHLVSKYNLGNPGTYRECIELLQKFNYINEELETKLIGMVGLRNLLSHEYKAIKIEKLYELLDHLKDIDEFIRQIKDYT